MWMEHQILFLQHNPLKGWGNIKPNILGLVRNLAVNHKHCGILSGDLVHKEEECLLVVFLTNFRQAYFSVDTEAEQQVLGKQDYCIMVSNHLN